MNKRFTKDRVVLFSGIVIVLLIIFIVSLKRNEWLGSDKVIEKPSIELNMAKDSILAIYKSYGIESKYVKELKANELKRKSLSYGAELTVPGDVSIPSVIREITQLFSKTRAVIKSSESKNGLDFESVIAIQNLWKIKLNYRYDKTLKRNEYMGAILVKYSKSISESELQNIIPLIKGVTIVLPLAVSSEKLAKKIESLGGNYMVDISEISDDQEFKFDSKFSQSRLKQSFDEINKHFPAVKNFYIKKKSTLYNSTIFPYIAKHFTQIKWKIIKDDKVIEVSSEKLQQNGLSLPDYMLNSTKNSSVSVLLTDDFGSVPRFTAKAFKLGYELVPVDTIYAKRKEFLLN